MESIAGPFRATKESVDYYVRYYSHKDTGLWFGSGAEDLGLGEYVTPEQLRSLFLGFHPDGTPLVQNAGHEKRQAFWDIVFGAPKAVSVLWATLPEAERKLIEEAHLKAVKITLGYLERQAGLSRRGKGGCHLENVGLFFALYQDYVSRELDPHLHTHCVLLNLGTRSDGTIGALWTQKMFDLKLEAGALYRAALENELRRTLGIRTEPDRFSFTLSDIPKELCENFSKRRKQIEAELERNGDYSAVAAKEAAIKTRGPSRKAEIESLLEGWQSVSREFGWDQEEALRALHRDRTLSREEPGQETKNQASDASHEKSQNRDAKGRKENFEQSKAEKEKQQTAETNSTGKKKPDPKSEIKREENDAIKNRISAEHFRDAMTRFASRFVHVREWALYDQGGPRITMIYRVGCKGIEEAIARPRKILTSRPLKLGPNHPKWGVIKKNLHKNAYGEFRWQKQSLFPNSPLTGLRNLELPALRWYRYDATERLRVSRASKRLRERNKLRREEKRKADRERFEARQRREEDRKKREEQQRRRQEEERRRRDQQQTKNR